MGHDRRFYVHDIYFRDDTDGMSFHTPLYPRLVFGLVFAFFLAVYLWVLWHLIPVGGIPRPRDNFDTRSPAEAFVCASLLCGGVMWLCGYVIQPYEMRLDTDRRTYCIRRGWPPLARTETGPLDEARELYIQCDRIAGPGLFGTPTYRLMLTWETGRADSLLGVSDDREEAEETIRGLSRRLRVPYTGAYFWSERRGL